MQKYAVLITFKIEFFMSFVLLSDNSQKVNFLL